MLPRDVEAGIRLWSNSNTGKMAVTMRRRRYRYDDTEEGDKVQGGTNRDDKKEIDK